MYIFVIIISFLVFAYAIYQIQSSHNKTKSDEEKKRKREAEKREIDNKISANKVTITPSLFTFEEAKQVMIGSDHLSCKEVYDFNKFFIAAFDCILKSIPQTTIVANENKEIKRTLDSFPVRNFKRLTKQTVLNSYRSFVSIDLETTGLDPEKHEIIEVSAIKFVDFDPIEMFHSYIKPSKSIPKRITDINNITDVTVADAPCFSQIAAQLQKFIEGFHLIAYNAQFDMSFLHTSGIDLGKHKSKVYDVLELARNNIKPNDYDYPENFKLSTVCESRHIGGNTFHSADSDSLACALLFIDIVKKINDVENAYALIDLQQPKNGIKPFYLQSYKGERF